MIARGSKSMRLSSVLYGTFTLAYLFSMGFRAGMAWERASALQPGLGFGEWVWRSLQDHGPVMAGGALVLLALLTMIYGVPGLNRPDRQRPEGPITPSLVLRHYPMHLGVCLGMLALAAWGLFTAPAIATIGVIGAMTGFVSLARRLGLEPPNDPAAPHNRGKV